MKIMYNVTGANRKKLVAAIAQELNTASRYLGMPTTSYEIGGYTVDRNGTLTGADNRELAAKLRDIHGFIATGEEYDTPDGDSAETAGEQMVVESGEHTATLALDDRNDRIIIEIPKESDALGIIAEHDVVIIEKLIKSKAGLIKKSLGVETLTIEQTDTTLRFPWFTHEADADRINVYARFITALCATAKKQRRAGGVEKPAENEKYAFRCFLLKLGFIGDEYRNDRKILLANLPGDGSFKNKENRRNTATADA